MRQKRNIKTIAPFLADDFVDLDEPIFDTEKYLSFLNANSDQLRNFKNYLIWKLHDSWILDFKKESNKLTIRLNDFSTHVFADAIVKKFKIDVNHDKLVFPLLLEFSGNLKTEFNRVDENGDLNSINQISVDEYLGEQVIKLQDDYKEIVFEFWHSNQNDDLPGERILLIVSASELKISEEQENTWNKIFGNVYNEYYLYFKEQFESGRYVSDYSECLKLVDEYEKLKVKKSTA